MREDEGTRCGGGVTGKGMGRREGKGRRDEESCEGEEWVSE